MKLLKEINWIVVIPVLCCALALIIINGYNSEMFGSFIEAAAKIICKDTGWFFGIITLVLTLIMGILLFHPVAKVRIGGKNEKPKYSFYSWCAMIVCSSIAIGIVFWGVAEPLYHYMDPCPTWGYEGGSDELIPNALAQSSIHYAFGQYSYYAFFGVLIALAAYNFKQPMAISSCFYFLGQKPIKSTWRSIIDMFCVLGTVFGVTYSLGVGVMQIASGLNEIFNIEITYVMWLVIAIGVVIFFTITGKLGVQKGLSKISDWNVYIYLFVLAFIFIVGPTTFILNMGQEGLGVYITQYIPKTLFTGGPNGEDWSVTWTSFMFASVVGVAPLVGLFYARISKGRTIRELVIGFWIVPSVLNIVWFNIFGGTGIFMQKTGKFDLWGAIQESGVEATIYKFFQSLPLGPVIIVIFLVCIIISFVTFADAMTGSISLLCLKDQSKLAKDEEAPASMKFVWGIVIGFTALAFITFGGIFTVRRAPILAGLPLFIVTAVLIFVFIRLFFTTKNQLVKESVDKLN